MCLRGGGLRKLSFGENWLTGALIGVEFDRDKAPLARFCYFSDKKRGNLGDKSTFLVEKKSTRYVGHKSC